MNCTFRSPLLALATLALTAHAAAITVQGDNYSISFDSTTFNAVTQASASSTALVNHYAMGANGLSFSYLSAYQYSGADNAPTLYGDAASVSSVREAYMPGGGATHSASISDSGDLYIAVAKGYQIDSISFTVNLTGYSNSSGAQSGFNLQTWDANSSAIASWYTAGTVIAENGGDALHTTEVLTTNTSFSTTNAGVTTFKHTDVQYVSSRPQGATGYVARNGSSTLSQTIALSHDLFDANGVPTGTAIGWADGVALNIVLEGALSARGTAFASLAFKNLTVSVATSKVVATSPVPEVDATLLALAGVGVAGSLVARRKREA